MCPLKLDFYFEIQLCYHRYISNDGNEIYCHKFWFFLSRRLATPRSLVCLLTRVSISDTCVSSSLTLVGFCISTKLIQLVGFEYFQGLQDKAHNQIVLYIFI